MCLFTDLLLLALAVLAMLEHPGRSRNVALGGLRGRDMPPFLGDCRFHRSPERWRYRRDRARRRQSRCRRNHRSANAPAQVGLGVEMGVPERRIERQLDHPAQPVVRLIAKCPELGIDQIILEPRVALVLAQLDDHAQVFDPLLVPALQRQPLLFLGKEGQVPAMVGEALVVVGEGNVGRAVERGLTRGCPLLRAELGQQLAIGLPGDRLQVFLGRGGVRRREALVQHV